MELQSAIESLEKMTFWNCAGLTNALAKALARMPRLRELNLESMANVTRDGVAAIPPTVRVNFLA